MPDAAVTGYSLPRKPRDPLTVLLRVPEETSEAVHSSVAVDQYSGQVLHVRRFRADSFGRATVRRAAFGAGEDRHDRGRHDPRVQSGSVSKKR